KKGRAGNCEVPLTVLMSSEATHRAFLRAYFAGDGGVLNRRAGNIACTSASERVLQDIQVMLLNFGLVSRLKATRSLATNGYRMRRGHWRLSIGGNDAVRFMQDIGFASDAKQAVADTVVARSHSLAGSARWDSVPGLAHVIQADERGIGATLR